MLERELEQINQAINQNETKEKTVQNKLNRAIEFYNALDPDGETTPNTHFNLRAFKADPSVTPWEERMKILKRTVNTRKILAQKSIPALTQLGIELPTQKVTLENQKKEILDTIRARLNGDREFIINAIRDGHLPLQDLRWIDEQYTHFNVEKPPVFQSPTPKLDKYFSEIKNNELIRRFMHSEDLEKLLNALTLEFNQRTTEDTELKGFVAGYIFESICATNARKLLVNRIREAFTIITPTDVVEIFRSIHPRKRIITDVHGLFRGIEGVSIPDILLVSSNKQDAEFFGLGEFSLKNPQGPFFGTKESQLKRYHRRDNEVIRDLRHFAETYNKRGSISHILDQYPQIAGRNLYVRNQDDNFYIWYFYPENFYPPAEYPKDQLVPVAVDSHAMGMFKDALLEDFNTEWTKFKTISFDSFQKSALLQRPKS